MTLYFYVDADVLDVIAPTPCGPFRSVINLFEDMVVSDPVARAEALAELITQQQPDLAALQEMFRISTQYPSNSFIPGNGFANFDVNQDKSITFIPYAGDVIIDYLELLLNADSICLLAIQQFNF